MLNTFRRSWVTFWVFLNETPEQIYFCQKIRNITEYFSNCGLQSLLFISCILLLKQIYKQMKFRMVSRIFNYSQSHKLNIFQRC